MFCHINTEPHKLYHAAEENQISGTDIPCTDHVNITGLIRTCVWFRDTQYFTMGAGVGGWEGGRTVQVCCNLEHLVWVKLLHMICILV
jgi:hypothetical protein